ncbi:tetratricopeptide repeat protein [Leptospira sp. GIMC2001]|uniref:tetratricopeptide repeat protein n=1 Tax=Leptospira sp. GIMC2001 TaxID=1513297 RepID=UPI00234B11DC|nr:tetratricopeptide repeat protein [Leptospira sp. GIMC2001]WCL47615.1 tetratricopeptide repeat protein [Leptospira sp. GIMC2001]
MIRCYYRIYISVIYLLFLVNPNILFAESFFDPTGNSIRQGIDFFYDKNYDNAVSSFEQAEDDLPDDPRIEFNKGSVKIHDGRHSEAITHLEKSLENPDPEWKSKSYYNLGKAYSAMGQKKKALDSYRKSLEYDPINKAARKNLELLYNQPQSNKANGSESNPNQNNSKDPSSGSNDQRDTKGNSSSKGNDNSIGQDPSTQNNGNDPDQLSRDQADRIMDSMNPDKIERRKNRGFFQMRRDKFW